MDNILAKKLFTKRIALNYKHNTIFTAISEYSSSSELVRKATIGLSKEVKADVNLFRNTILPVTKDFEVATKTKSKITPIAVADKVTIHTSQYNDGLDILEEVYNLDTNVVVSAPALPANPLIIRYDKGLIEDNITNHRVKEAMDEILLEYEDGYLGTIHNKLFSGVSRNSDFIKNLGINALDNYNDLYLGLVLTLGYINGTIGVSNVVVAKVRPQYLYTLRDILVTALNNYRSTYDIYLKREFLISRVTTDESGKIRVYLIGELYSKYLEDHNVDAIIGYANNVKNSTRITLSDFVNNIDTYVDYYESAIRIASMRSAVDHVNVLRLAYKLVAREYLAGLTDGQLNNLDLTTDGLTQLSVSDVNRSIEQYIDNLNTEELLEVTEVTRYIVSVFIYRNEGFLKFIGYMNYYTKLFPKLSVDEIATSAMVAHTMDKLEPQLIVEQLG